VAKATFFHFLFFVLFKVAVKLMTSIHDLLDSLRLTFPDVFSVFRKRFTYELRFGWLPNTNALGIT